MTKPARFAVVKNTRNNMTVGLSLRRSSMTNRRNARKEVTINLRNKRKVELVAAELKEVPIRKSQRVQQNLLINQEG